MAEIAVTLVIDKLIPLLSEEAKILKGVHVQLADIKKELDYIQAFLRDADAMAEKEDRSDVVKLWVKDVREVAECIEDVIEEYNFHITQHGQRHGFKGFFQKVAHLVRSLKHQHDITSEIQNIKTSLSQIKTRGKMYESKEQGSSSNATDVTWYDPRLEAHFIGEAEVVGIGSSRDELITWLVKGTSQLIAIAVLGMGGIGKTTLAKKAFDNDRVKQHFDHCIWITVSQSYNMKELLKDMIRRCYDTLEGTAAEETNTFDEVSLISKLRRCLQNKRCVVVFDDLWNKDFWRTMKHVFPDDNKGSRIIVTTRNHDVASSCKEFSIVHIYKMQPLPPEKAMELFCKRAFKYSIFEGRCPPELEQLSVDIVARCKGLPLAIVVIGGLLSTKEMVVSEWKNFHDNLSLEFENNPDLTSIKKILSFSYHDLPYYLKPCFLYLGMYPEDYAVRCPTLIKKWIAEGFVNEDKCKTLEEIANKYLSELIHRSLVQVSMVKDGKAKFLKIHDLIREVILSKATDLNFYQVLEKEDASFHGRSRRLSIMDEFLKTNGNSNVWDNHNHENSRNVLNSFQRYRYPLSIIFIDTKKFQGTAQDFGNILHKGIASGYFLRLQILDLGDARVYTTGLPNNIGELIHLMNLNLRGTLIKEIPPSFFNLPNLHTLDLMHTSIRIFHIPTKKLQKLKHLYLDSRTKFVTQLSDNSLKNLQTLKTKLEKGYRDDDSPLIDGLDKLINLRELKLKLDIEPSQQKKVTDHVVKLKHLHSLKLTTAKANAMHHGVLWLEPLSGLENLTLLNLHGVISDSRVIINTNGLPQTLTHLKLTMCDLSDDPMPVLEKLHNLRWLFLSSGSYTGSSMVCSKGGFPQLLYLKFSELELKEWNIEEQAMQRLMEIEVKQCWSLEVPTGLKNVKSLCQLKFKNMPPAFMALIEKTKEQNWEIINFQGPVIMEFGSP
nr:putative disease resistance protein At1g50180 [Quercus suber]